MRAAGRMLVAVGSKVAPEQTGHSWRLGNVSIYHFVSRKTVKAIKGQLWVEGCYGRCRNLLVDQLGIQKSALKSSITQLWGTPDFLFFFKQAGFK